MTQRDVTFDAVEKVSNALIAEGLKPTVRAVRERLGGSHTTLVRHLRTWNEARSALEHQARDLPGELVLAMRRSLNAAESAGRAQLLQQLEASQHTADELAQESEALCEQLQAAEIEAATLRSERDGLLGKLEAAAERQEDVSQELYRERQCAGEVRSELAKAAVRAEALERAVNELREREQAARVSCDQLQCRHDELVARVAGEHAAVVSLSAQLEAERRRNEALQLKVDEAGAASSAHTAAMERAAGAEAASAELRRTVETLQGLLGHAAGHGSGVATSLAGAA